MQPALNDVYQQLRVIARQMLRREPYQHTLESCELVHLAWARLLGGDLSQLTRNEPEQVIALAITNMRRELIDHARKRRAGKRPDAKIRVDLDDAPGMIQESPDTLLAVDKLLTQLSSQAGRIRHGARKAECAQYALYGGLSESEISKALGIPKSTVGSDLRFVKAWLQKCLADDGGL